MIMDLLRLITQSQYDYILTVGKNRPLQGLISAGLGGTAFTYIFYPDAPQTLLPLLKAGMLM